MQLIAEPPSLPLNIISPSETKDSIVGLLLPETLRTSVFAIFILTSSLVDKSIPLSLSPVTLCILSALISPMSNLSDTYL